MSELDEAMSAADFWNNKESAQAQVEELSTLRAKVNPLLDLDRQVGDLEVLKMLVEEEQDESAVSDLKKEYAQVEKSLAAFELQSLLSGPQDKFECVHHHSFRRGRHGIVRLGGYAAAHVPALDRAPRLHSTMIDIQVGDEAGIKSATLLVAGNYAFGYLATERGVHRLVRISPFDANKRRHTSFASMDIVPEIADDAPIEINPADIELDTYRAAARAART
ncbi:MAG: PCRF domain-containing protein [Chthoniobacteraceae bacterium]